MNHIVFVMPWMSIAMVGNMDLGESLKKIELVCRMLDLYPRCKVAEHRVHWRGRADCLCDQAGCRGADLETALETNGFWGGIPNRGLLLPFSGFLLKILTFCEMRLAGWISRRKDQPVQVLKAGGLQAILTFLEPCLLQLDVGDEKSKSSSCFLDEFWWRCKKKNEWQQLFWEAFVGLLSQICFVCSLLQCRTSFRSQCSVRPPMRRPRPRARTFLPTRQVCLPHDTCVTQKSHLWKLFFWGPDAPSSDTSWCVWCWSCHKWCFEVTVWNLWKLFRVMCHWALRFEQQVKPVLPTLAQLPGRPSQQKQWISQPYWTPVGCWHDP